MLYIPKHRRDDPARLMVFDKNKWKQIASCTERDIQKTNTNEKAYITFSAWQSLNVLYGRMFQVLWLKLAC